MEKLTIESLDKLNQHGQKELNNCIKVGMSTCGIAAGAEEVYNFLSEQLAASNISIPVKKCGCIGMCFAEPMVEVKFDDMPSVLYGRVTKEVALQIIEEHQPYLLNKCIEVYLYDNSSNNENNIHTGY
jgi:NADP-reducing hydrogenase subunit HndB